jgi:DME family drug/metabolite transporter
LLNRSQGYIISSTIGLSFILIFSQLLKDTGMSSFEQLLLRICFSFVILLVFMLFKDNIRLTAVSDAPFFLVIGFTYALFALCGLSALAFGTPIPVSVALVYTQPIFTALISQATGKERVSRDKTAIIFLGVIGAFLVSGINVARPQFQPGIALAVSAGLLYAVYLWLKRRAPLDRYTPYQVLFNTFAFAILLVPLSWLVLRNFSGNSMFIGVTVLSTQQMILLFLFALLSTVLPYSLLNYVKPEDVSPTTEGLFLLGDPLLHMIWATIFLSQFISGIQYVGAALILVSAVLNIMTTTKP